jgi:tripartite-type tricarboxylate transporter receptor subunit TctC
VIENKAGAGGILGADLVAKSRPDGYTLLLGSSSTQVTGPLLIPNPPYHPVKDFTLFIIGFVPMVISCNPGLPASTLPEFVALLRANPDKYRYASSGMGSIGHLGSELFKLKAGRLVSLHVPYKGNNPAVQAALSGEVDSGCSTQSARPTATTRPASCGIWRSAPRSAWPSCPSCRQPSNAACPACWSRPSIRSPCRRGRQSTS